MPCACRKERFLLYSVDCNAPGVVRDPPAGHGPAGSVRCGLLILAARF